MTTTNHDRRTDAEAPAPVHAYEGAGPSAASPPPSARQDRLAASLACYYATHATTEQRPHCRRVAVVAYGTIPLCETCNLMRSAVGRTHGPRALPGAELHRLIDAAGVLARAEADLAIAVGAARAAGASWSQIGDAVGVSRQAAQQRWTTTPQAVVVGAHPANPT